MAEESELSVEYQVPDRLPAPGLVGAENPVPAVLLGVLAAVVLGVVFFGATRLVYIYILYNSFLGVGVGWAISAGLKQGKYLNRDVLMAITAGCSLLVYVTFFVAYHQWLMSETGESFGFFDAVSLRAQYELFLWDWEIGTVGNVILWIIEYAITLYFAWRAVKTAILVCQVESVPTEVVEYTAHLFSQGHGVEHIRQELSKKGWTSEQDQMKAIRAVDGLISLHSQALEES